MRAPFSDNLSSTLVKSSAHLGNASGPPGAVPLAVDAARRAPLIRLFAYTSPSSPRTASFLRALPGLEIVFHLLTGSLVRLPRDTCARRGLNILAQRLGVAFLLLHPSPGGGVPWRAPVHLLLREVVPADSRGLGEPTSSPPL